MCAECTSFWLASRPNWAGAEQGKCKAMQRGCALGLKEKSWPTCTTVMKGERKECDGTVYIAVCDRQPCAQAVNLHEPGMVHFKGRLCLEDYIIALPCFCTHSCSLHTCACTCCNSIAHFIKVCSFTAAR